MSANPPDHTDTAVTARWNASADQWTNDVRADFDVYRDVFTWPALASFLAEINGLRLVGLGCGEGTNTREMARLGATPTGIDLSERLIAHARAAEVADPLGITYHIGSYSERAPFPDASFDVAVSTLALMDGPDLASAFCEAFRLLRPGGTLVFSVLHPCLITRVPGGSATPMARPAAWSSPPISTATLSARIGSSPAVQRANR